MKKFITGLALALTLGAPNIGLATIYPNPKHDNGGIPAMPLCIAPVDQTDSVSAWQKFSICLNNRISQLEKRITQLEQGTKTSISDRFIALPPEIKQGSSSTEVKAVQELLKEEIPNSVSTTGYFGPVTKKAIEKFQAKRGLNKTGKIDGPTLEKMKELAPQIAPNANNAIQKIKLQTKP